jgi:type IV secretory pathway TrbD component
VDLNSLSRGERIAAASGVALFLLLFPSWLQDQSAWELFKIIDVLLAILAVFAVAVPVAKAVGYQQQLRPSDRTILIRIGTVALVLVLAYFLEAFNNAQIGLWLSLLAAAGIFYGGMATPSEDTQRRRRDRARRPRSESDFEEPPPGMENWRSGALGDEEADAAPAAPGGEGRAGDQEPARTAPSGPDADTDPGPGTSPPRRPGERARRESAFEELEFDPEPQRTEPRRRRPSSEEPPPTER